MRANQRNTGHNLSTGSQQVCEFWDLCARRAYGIVLPGSGMHGLWPKDGDVGPIRFRRGFLTFGCIHMLSLKGPGSMFAVKYGMDW